MIVSLTTTDLFKLLAFGPVRIKSIHGWNQQGVDLYIQIFSDSVTLTGGGTAKPTEAALLAQQNNGFYYELNWTLPMANYALSSTPDVYTAVATGITITFDIDTDFFCDGTETKVTGSGVTTLTIWSEATGAAAVKRLRRLEVTTATAVDLWGLIYAVTTPVAGSLIYAATLFPGSATTVVLYGDDKCGLTPYQQNADYSQHRGCILQMSDTYVAAHQYGGSAPSMIALYK
jgi:hypothetical protein